MTTIATLEPVVVNVSPKTNWTFVAVTTDDGATGWGECSLNGWEHLLVPQANALARDAVGREVDAVGDLVRYLAHSPGGLVAHAVKSAAEQALIGPARRARRPVDRAVSRRVAAHGRAGVREHQSWREGSARPTDSRTRQGARSPPAIAPSSSRRSMA